MRNDLLVRAITGITFLAITFAVYYFKGNTGLTYFALLCTCFPIIEYAGLTQWVLRRNKSLFIFLALAGLLLLGLTEVSMGLVLCLLMVTYICGSLIVHRGKSTSNEQKLQTQLYGGFGFIYVVAIPIFAVKLIAASEFLFLGLLVIVFSGDIMAYLGGMTFGKHKLYEELSPKKSIEGSVSGLFGSVIFGLIWYYLFNIDQLLNMTSMDIVLMSLVCGLAAQLGDLFESLLKRLSGKKDSGKFLPGHGGFLDRFDGIYFGAPIFYFFIQHFR